MDLNSRIRAFIQLGSIFAEITDNKGELGESARKFKDIVESVNVSNEWFTNNNLTLALSALAKNLNHKTIEKWINRYPSISNNISPKRIGVVSAGNIPLVSFHDFISILLTGNEIVIKLSSKDDKLLKGIANALFTINKGFEELISFENEYFKKFDAIIATGSDNSSRYFEYYFGKYPNIIRKNRNSVAVLNGEESEKELELLADDILSYFGLGCRNISKIFIPEGFDIQKIFKSVFKYKHYADHNKYANNYTYNKSIYLMNKEAFWENGFLMLKEETGMSSPISVVYFEYYKNISVIKERIRQEQEQIQCIVARNGLIENCIYFGEAQKPKLWDYADNVDTLEFLLSLP